MSGFWRLLNGVAWFVLSIVGSVGAASACSICLAGDPIYDALGGSAQEANSWSMRLQGRGWKKNSNLMSHGDDHDDDHEGGREHADNQRIDLFVSYTPIDRLTFVLDLPWAFNEITEKVEGEREKHSLSGFSDLSLSATGVVWRNRSVLPSTWLEVRSFLKMPTGQRRQSKGGVKDPHLQVGTGSWDFGFGLAGVHRIPWASLYTSVSYRVNTEGSLGYEYGDVILANSIIQVPVGHAARLPMLDWLTASMQLNYRWADRDGTRQGKFKDSGGSIVYLTPGVSIALPWFGNRRPPKLQGSVQMPLTNRWLNGDQEEKPVWSVGLQYAF